MTRIGVLSDTHAYLDERIFEHFNKCDDIWHAGDIGSMEVVQKLSSFKPLRAVHGNIDGGLIRSSYPQFLNFTCEKVSVLLTHIGGYPGRYAKEVRQQLLAYKPDLFVCGHSHILKVQFDQVFNTLCLNPGAAGLEGFHHVRTVLRFEIDGKNIQNLEVIEMPKH
jgi:hypothetical protein